MWAFRLYSWLPLLFRNSLLLLFWFQSNDLQISWFLSFGDGLRTLAHYWSWKLCLDRWSVRNSKSWFCMEIFLFSRYSKKYKQISWVKNSVQGMAVRSTQCTWSVLCGLAVAHPSWPSTSRFSQLKHMRNCIFRILVSISRLACLAWI